MPSHPGTSNWQSQMPSHSATPNWKPPIPSHIGTSNWHSQMPSHSDTPNWQPPIPSHPHDVGLFNPNILNRARRKPRPSIYRQSPYMDLPPTTVLPKKRVDKTKNKGKNANVSPLNLGNAFVDYNVGGDDVMITGEHETGIYFTYENMDPNKRVGCPGTMNAWIELLIRDRPQNADWTMSKSGTACAHPENKWFMIQTDQHIIGTLNGSTRPYPSWKDVNWVYMPINAGGNH
ncbi:hypothetical protein Tco_0829260 [Tanacetum coccineum]